MWERQLNIFGSREFIDSNKLFSRQSLAYDNALEGRNEVIFQFLFFVDEDVHVRVELGKVFGHGVSSTGFADMFGFQIKVATHIGHFGNCIIVEGDRLGTRENKTLRCFHSHSSEPDN